MHNWADQAEHAGASTKYPASLLYLCSLPLDSVASQPSCRYLPLDVILCLLSHAQTAASSFGARPQRSGAVRGRAAGTP